MELLVKGPLIRTCSTGGGCSSTKTGLQTNAFVCPLLVYQGQAPGKGLESLHIRCRFGGVDHKELLKEMRKCAPRASVLTKKLLLQVGKVAHEELLDSAARDFADCARSAEGMEGMMSFIQKRKPSWAKE